jgi:superoxide dismutase
MRVHHTKHHAGYLRKVNNALRELKRSSSSDDALHRFASQSLDNILLQLDEQATLAEQVRTQIRNNGGGFVNHAFFFFCMQPPTPAAGSTAANQGGGGEEPRFEIPEPAVDSAVAHALVAQFGSVAEFRARFAALANTQFGSGWAWVYARRATSDDNAAAQLHGIVIELDLSDNQHSVFTRPKQVAILGKICCYLLLHHSLYCNCIIFLPVLTKQNLQNTHDNKTPSPRFVGACLLSRETESSQ